MAAHPSLNTQKKNPANEQLLFHGTNRCCLLVEDGNRVRLCGLPQCHLCCVIRNSFDVTKCGKCHLPPERVTSSDHSPGTKHKFRRFGNGIYTTACSSSGFHLYSYSVSSLKHFQKPMITRTTQTIIATFGCSW